MNHPIDLRVLQDMGGISGSRASTEPSGLGPSGIDPGRNEVADKLREARGYIERRWCRRDYMSANGGVCAVGALQKAFNGHPEDCSVSPGIADAETCLRRAIGGHSIVGWNDSQASKRPVLAAFDMAIEFAEKSA